MLPLLATASWSPTCGRKTRSHVTRRVVGVVALSFCLSGYCCSGDVCDWNDPPQPTRSPTQAPTLELSPVEFTTSPGGVFTLALTALDAFGDRVALSPDLVTWSHTAEVANPADIGLAPSSEGVMVTLPGGVALDPFWVMAAAPDFGDAQARIRVLLGASNDWVSLPHTPGKPNEAILLDAERAVLGGMSTPTCLSDFRVMVQGDADLGLNLVGGCGDPTEVAVFSVDHGMLFEPGTGSTSDPVPPWTTGRNVLERTSLPPVYSVPVHIRIRVKPGDETDAEADARKEVLELASAIFRQGRVGVEFALDEANGVGSVEVEAHTEAFDTVSCRDPVELGSLGVDPTTKGLYVVYAPGVKDSYGHTWKGWACIRMEDEDAGVVVVSYPEKSLTTAAHELGHAFGLTAPLPKYGHTGKFLPIHGFTPSNLMWTGEDIDVSDARKHISLGQAFRMNLDRHSWLIHEFNLSGEKNCQCKPYEAKECPFLFLDVVDIGLPSGGGTPECKDDPWGLIP